MQVDTSDPKWLEKVQNRSWEIELIVSGGSLFSLIQLSQVMFQVLDETVKVNFVLSSGLMLYVFVIPVLTGGFTIHLVLRSFWLAMVVLHRVYPSGINYTRVNLSERYLASMKRFSFIDNIIRLDKICSTIFSASFISSLIIAGFSVLAGLTMWFSFFPLTNQKLMENPWFFIPYGLFMIVFMVAYMLNLYIDLPTFGYFRRGKWWPKVWYPFYRMFNFLTLGFWWRPYLQVITSNQKSKWAIFVWIIVLYSTGVGFIVYLDNENQIVQFFDRGTLAQKRPPSSETNYQDKIGEDSWYGVSIQSDVIVNGYLKVFVPVGKLKSEFDDFRIVSPDSIKITLDDSISRPVEWVALTRKSGQRGVVSVLDIRSLKVGLHEIGVIAIRDSTKIPFWKQ